MPSGDYCTVCPQSEGWHSRCYQQMEDQIGRQAADEWSDRHAPWLTVRVEALNDDGDKYIGYGRGATSDAAVENAIDTIRRKTNDDSFVMNEWSAA